WRTKLKPLLGTMVIENIGGGGASLGAAAVVRAAADGYTVSGQVPMGIVGVTGPLLEFHRSGKTRIPAVTNPTRLGVAPELPTVAESGLPGLTVTGSIGLLAPAATPGAIIERIAQATRAAVAERSYQQLLIEAGIEPTPDST